MENLESLVIELIKYKNETNWFEFKHNNFEPDMIGKDISALANSATLVEKACAYMIWGIDDKTHEIVGTEQDQYTTKIGNEELENWLRRLLSPNASFEFHKITLEDKKVIVLVIHKAINQTVTFKKSDYIRVGSYTKSLSEYPQLQAQVWDKIRNERYEEQYAKWDLTLEEIFEKLDYTTYFSIKELPIPVSINNIAHFFIEEDFIEKQDNGLYAITNLGAILFAKNLSSFTRLNRKAIRVVQYDGNNRINMLRNEIETRGYAICFVEVLRLIEMLLPSTEIILNGLREKKTSYPSIAIREAVANALIHQDLSISGTGVVVELFDNKIEITNPGRSLVDINRIIDNPPKSRNEKLASVMRKLKMCEELGTGWDKIISACEKEQLPAPLIDLYDENTKVTLFSKKEFSDLSSTDKLRACYTHACILYTQGEYLTNTSLRKRFGVDNKSAASISRLIKDGCEKGLIKKFEDTAPRYVKYVPYWA